MKTQANITPLLFSSFAGQISVFFLILLIPTQSPAAEAVKIKPQEVPDACNTNIPQVRVTVNNVGSGGILNVELYNGPDHFLFKKGRIRKVRIPAVEGRLKVCMNLEQPGTYAVAAYHDRDGNRKLKKNWNLLPLEPFGLSNNPEYRFSFPRFTDAAFTAGSLGADIVIDLKQPPDP